jgi:glycosyltransferase involved in cell wall biosynthesis
MFEVFSRAWTNFRPSGAHGAETVGSMRSPTLAELPPPPSGKTGWPWTVETPPLPPVRPDGTPWPRISIVTPSYNQGRFIEETIRSVLLQGYPNLEYIIIDGGSTDQTIEIIKKYELRITHWVSEPDNGQSNAINKGFSRATGEILAWINSDDMYLPGTLARIATAFVRYKVDIVTGGQICYPNHSAEKLAVERAAGFGLKPTLARLFVSAPYLHQSSTFWTRDIWQKTDRKINEDLHYAMDADLWFQFMKVANVRTKIINGPLSLFRKHESQKTNIWTEYERELDLIRSLRIADMKKNLGFRMRVFLWKKLLPILHHRNVHPRLGLRAPGDVEALKRLLGAS